MASYHFSVKCGNYNGRKTSATNHLNYINRDGQFKNLDKKNNSNKQVNECIYKENFLPAWAEGSAKNFGVVQKSMNVQMLVFTKNWNLI